MKKIYMIVLIISSFFLFSFIMDESIYNMSTNQNKINIEVVQEHLRNSIHENTININRRLLNKIKTLEYKSTITILDEDFNIFYSFDDREHINHINLLNRMKRMHIDEYITKNGAEILSIKKVSIENKIFYIISICNKKRIDSYFIYLFISHISIAVLLVSIIGMNE